MSHIRETVNMLPLPLYQ